MARRWPQHCPDGGIQRRIGGSRGAGRNHPGPGGWPDRAGRVRGDHSVVRHRADGWGHGAAGGAVLPRRAKSHPRPRVCGDFTRHDAHYRHGRSCVRRATGSPSRARCRHGVARLPDCFLQFDRVLCRGELYVFASGPRPAQMERGASQPARAQCDRNRCAMAAPVAHAGQRSDRSRWDHAAAARLGLPVLPTYQPRSRPRASRLGPPVGNVRSRADRGPYARGP